MGDAIFYFRTLEDRERAKEDLSVEKDVKALKSVGRKTLFVEFDQLKTSPSKLWESLKSKGLEGVLSSL